MTTTITVNGVELTAEQVETISLALGVLWEEVRLKNEDICPTHKPRIDQIENLMKHGWTPGA
jgi:hypothetical protein